MITRAKWWQFHLSIFLLVFLSFSIVTGAMPANHSNFDIVIMPSPMILDINQSDQQKIAVRYNGEAPDSMTLSLIEENELNFNNLKFFKWENESRNLETNSNQIDNMFTINSSLSLMREIRTQKRIHEHVESDVRTGVYNLHFLVRAYRNGIVTDSIEIPYQVIIKPAILSTHRASKGTNCIIEWMESDSMYSFIDPHDPTLTLTTIHDPGTLSKSTRNRIRKEQIDGLNPNYSYTYYIESKTLDFSVMDTSKSVTIYQDATPPPPVTDLFAKSVSGARIRLEWKYQKEWLSKDLKGFRIYRREDHDELSILKELNIKTFPYIKEFDGQVSYEFYDTFGLKEGFNYTYKVVAVDTVGNISDGILTLPQIPDRTIPPDAVFIWEEDSSYDWRNWNAPQYYVAQGFPVLDYKKGKTTRVKISNPNKNTTSTLDSVKFVCFQWVRNYSHFFDPMDTVAFSDKNSFSSGWLDIDKLKHNTDFIWYNFDFSNGGFVSDNEINGNLYKYRAIFKDKAGNISADWSRLNQDNNLVGAIQDIFPPSNVTKIKSVLEILPDFTIGYINLQWDPSEDPVSGLAHYSVFRSLDDDIFSEGSTYDTVFVTTKPFLHDTLQSIFYDTLNNSFPFAAQAHYWILPEDNVGNRVSFSSFGLPVVVDYRTPPRLLFKNNNRWFRDTLTVRIQYYTTLNLEGFDIYVDDQLFQRINEISGRLVDMDVSIHLEGVELQKYKLYVRAKFTNGESINSNILYPIKKVEPPTEPGWLVYNKDVSVPISKNFSNFPTIKIFSLDKDIHSIYIANKPNVTENSQLLELNFLDTDSEVLFCGNVQYDLTKPLFSGDTLVFVDTCATPLEFRTYNLTVKDSAGNIWQSKSPKSAFGVEPPEIRGVRFNPKDRTLLLDLSYSKILYNKSGDSSTYRIVIDTLYYNPALVDIDSIFQKRSGYFDSRWKEWGPKDTKEPFGGPYMVRDEFITRGIELENVDPLLSGDKHETLYIYALFYNKPKEIPDYLTGTVILHSRADIDSFDGRWNIQLQQPKFTVNDTLYLIDEPGAGSFYVDWGMDINSANAVKPNVFKIQWGVGKDTVVTGPVLLRIPSDIGESVTFKIKPGLSVLNSDTFWSPTWSDTYQMVDTQRGFIPFHSFPINSEEYFAKGDTVYFNTHSITVKWNWNRNKSGAENNFAYHVGTLKVKIANNSAFNNAVYQTVVNPDTLHSIREITFHEVDNPTRGGMAVIDTLYVTITAFENRSNDLSLHNVWPDTTVLILDDEPPEAPLLANTFTSWGWTYRQDKINQCFVWDTPADKKSGLGLLFDVDIKGFLNESIRLNVQKDSINPDLKFYWKPSPTGPDTLQLVNIDTSKFDEHVELSIAVHVKDNLGNGSTFEFRDFEKPSEFGSIRMYQVPDKKYRIEWDSVENADRYVINYWNTPNNLGFPSSSFVIIDSTNYITDFNTTDAQYVHVCAILKNNNATLWSNLVRTDTVSISSPDGYIISAMEDDANLPKEFSLKQNYPNPFNLSTTIQFELPRSTFVSISIFDLTGRKVRQLLAGNVEAGRHVINWNATDDRGAIVATGVYFIVMESADFRSIKKCILMK